MSSASYSGFIESVEDALVLFEAYRCERIRGFLRRLTEDEKKELIRPNRVFVWSEDNGAIKRWSDGRRWSSSKVSGSFLIYKEVLSSEAERQGVLPLSKRTLSMPIENGNGKIHLVCYFMEGQPNDMVTPSVDPRLADITSMIRSRSASYPIRSRQSDAMEGRPPLVSNSTSLSLVPELANPLQYGSRSNTGPVRNDQRDHTGYPPSNNLFDSTQGQPMSLDPIYPPSRSFGRGGPPRVLSPPAPFEQRRINIEDQPLISPRRLNPTNNEYTQPFRSLLFHNWRPDPRLTPRLIHELNRRALRYLVFDK